MIKLRSKVVSQAIGKTNLDVLRVKYQTKSITMTEIRPFLSPELREAGSAASECNKNPNGVRYFRKNGTNTKLSCFRIEDTGEEVRFNVISSKKQQPSSLRRDVHAPMLSLGSGNTQGDGSGGRSPFYPRWGNRIHSGARQHPNSGDLFFKRTTLLPPVSSRACSVIRTESPCTVIKSCTLISEDGCRLNGVPSVPVSITTTPVSEHSMSKTRRIKSRVCNPATIKLTPLGQAYADPVMGASASFIQRLLELSSLQAKTVRQEKIKELKKNRRHEP